MKNILRAEFLGDRSGDVLVSFSSHWAHAIRSGEISVVFRKRVPQTSDPRVMFIYLSSPESVLFGKAKIEKLEILPVSDAIGLADEGKISVGSLSSYVAGKDTVGAYFISDIEVFVDPKPLYDMQNMYGFSPPQSFFFLSNSGSAVLEKLETLVAREELNIDG